MLHPVKLKLAPFEAEALRQYMQHMLRMSADRRVRNEVIVLAEFFPKFDAMVRNRFFRSMTKVSTYTVPLSVARILWARWQKEDNGNTIQLVLGKVDYYLNTIDKLPDFPTQIF